MHIPVVERASGRGAVISLSCTCVPSRDGQNSLRVSGLTARPGAFDAVLANLTDAGASDTPGRQWLLESAGSDLPVSGRSARLGIAVAAFLAADQASPSSRVLVQKQKIAFTGDLSPSGHILPVDSGTLPAKAAAASQAGCAVLVVPPSQVQDVSGASGVTLISAGTFQELLENPELFARRARSVASRARRRPVLAAAVGTLLIALLVLGGVGVSPTGTRPPTVLERFGPTGIGLFAGNAQRFNWVRRIKQFPNGDLLLVGTGASEVGGPISQFVARLNPDGSLVTGFGTDGFRHWRQGENTNGLDVVMEPDGSFVVAGTAKMTLAGDFSLTKYLPDGSPDPDFGDGGFVWTHVAYHTDRPYAIRRQQDGRFVVAGDAHSGVDYDFAIVRYLPDGRLDDSFGADGVVITDIDGLDGIAGLALLPDGGIVVSGWSGFRATVARYTRDGALEESFGSDGFVRLAAPADREEKLTELAIGPDGSIVASGFSRLQDSDYRMLVVRLDQQGNLDSRFADYGVARLQVGGVSDGAHDLAISPDGSVTLVGYTESVRGDSDLLIVRLGPEGRVMEAATSTLDIAHGGEMGYDLEMLDDGTLLVAGVSRRPDVSEMVLLRVPVEADR
ncbi:MAG: hypothetical protein JJ976_11530 [Rhodothermales bacterium]|nr:hypothetical protein [Rhodothermales bacterium]